MKNETQKATEQELLDKMYKNVTMGSESIVNIMPKVGNEKLRGELCSQLDRYEDFSKQISVAIEQVGGTPKPENMVSRVSAKMGVAMNTMMDSSTSHIAEMIIKGATMGITDMTRTLREYENSSCSENSLKLARQITAFEEDTVERMKQYL